MLHTLCMFGADLSRFLDLDGAEREALKRLTDDRVTFGRNTVVRAANTPVESLYVIQNGWSISSLKLGKRRQITNIGLPGDMVGLGEVAASRTIHEIRTITEVEVSRIGRDAFGTFVDRYPRLAVRILLLGERRKRYHAEWLCALGRRTARQRIALFLVTIQERLKPLGLADDAFEMPMRQQDIGDFTGLTSVSVSKTLGELQLEKTIRCAYGEIRILDHERLRNLADPLEDRLDIDTEWLHLQSQPVLRSEGA